MPAPTTSPAVGHPAVHPQADPISFDGPFADHAVEVAPRIWWVGTVVPDDPFQTHAYLIEAGRRSVLVDPGSELTIDGTLIKIREVVDLEDISTIILHHSDPDCADAIHRLGDVLGHAVRIVTEPTAVMMIDLDEFKRVNDTWGHQVGDEVLRRVASVIRTSLRPGDRAIRYGGEEITVIAPVGHRDDAVAERAADARTNQRRRPEKSSSSIADSRLSASCDDPVASPA